MVVTHTHLNGVYSGRADDDPARPDFAFPPVPPPPQRAGLSPQPGQRPKDSKVIADPLRHANQMIDDLIKRAETPIQEAKPVVPIDELADLAASMVDIEIDTIDVRDNAGRDLGSKAIPEPAQSMIVVDATDALQADTDEWGEGSFVQSTPCGDVRVNVEHPGLFVVDADGNHIVGARIMCEFTTITLDVA